MNDNRGLKRSDICICASSEGIHWPCLVKNCAIPYKTVKSVTGAAHSSSLFLYAMFSDGEVPDCGKNITCTLECFVYM
jgi:hypothetical protein